jgi:hypothetical protein
VLAAEAHVLGGQPLRRLCKLHRLHTRCTPQTPTLDPQTQQTHRPTDPQTQARPILDPEDPFQAHLTPWKTHFRPI